ncbi:MAG: DUF4139 domain-containing protein [Firmicutes bacterium]|nr:DUF4139 domain-containing protein [Bacillota bacterium]
MRAFTLLSLSLLGLCAWAQGPVTLEAPIRSVRLHPDEAWITRVGKFRANTTGTQRFRIEGLPAKLGLDDVRVSLRGPQGTRLGDLGIGSQVLKITETPDYLALKRERNEAQDAVDLLTAEGEALAQEQLFLKNLQASYDKELSSKMTLTLPSAEAVVTLSKGLQERLARVLSRERKRRHEWAERKEALDRLNEALEQKTAQRSTSPSFATVEASFSRPGDVEVELTYRNRSARWNPQYEARLSQDGKRVELVLFAAVNQNSGEDWSNVRLEITNARASRSLTLATFKGPLTLNYQDQRPLAKKAWASATVEVVADAAPAPPPPPTQTMQNTYLQEAAPEEASPMEEAQGLAATWSLEGLKDVPSDNEPHRFRVLSKELEPALALVATPRLDPTVHQVARFPIPAGIPWFPNAPVVHYAGTQRVGASPLLLPSPGKPMTFGFGPYRGVRVALERLDAKKETVGTFTKETQWTLRERFQVSNDTDLTLNVELLDRELVSTHDRVKVLPMPESTPSQEGPRPGLRLWTLSLKPKGETEVRLSTQIRMPIEGFVPGLDDLNLPR